MYAIHAALGDFLTTQVWTCASVVLQDLLLRIMRVKLVSHVPQADLLMSRIKPSVLLVQGVSSPTQPRPPLALLVLQDFIRAR